MGVYNNAIGHTQITVGDLKKSKVRDISDEKERLKILQKHCSDAEKAPTAMFTISFSTSSVDNNVDVVIRDSLYGKDVAREVALPQLNRLRALPELGGV